MITEYSEFVRFMISDLPGCRQALIINQLAESTRAICDETECFKVTSEETLDIDKKVILQPSYEANIKRITRVFTKSDTGYETDREYVYDPETVELEVTDVEPEAIVFVKSALLPYVDSSGIEPNIFNTIFSAVKFHALHELTAQSKKPWSNERKSARYGAKMDHEINKIKSENIKQGTNKQQHIQLPGWN